MSDQKLNTMTYSISSKVFLTSSGRSLNLVDFVNCGGPCPKVELVRIEDCPKAAFWVGLPNLRNVG